MAALPIEVAQFDEVFEFLASSPTAQQLLDFQPSEGLQARLSALLEKNRGTGLSVEERIELEEFFKIDRFMSRVKLQARKKAIG